jgi:hypothetical protein
MRLGALRVSAEGSIATDVFHTTREAAEELDFSEYP